MENGKVFKVCGEADAGCGGFPTAFIRLSIREGDRPIPPYHTPLLGHRNNTPVRHRGKCTHCTLFPFQYIILEHIRSLQHSHPSCTPHRTQAHIKGFATGIKLDDVRLLLLYYIYSFYHCKTPGTAECYHICPSPFDRSQHLRAQIVNVFTWIIKSHSNGLGSVKD